MLKTTKIKGGKFTIPSKGPFKIQKMFANNTMELSTINDERVEKIDINKLKVYHHNPPTNVIIVDVIVDTKPNSKIGGRHRKTTKLNFPPKLHTNQRIYPGLTKNLEKHLMKIRSNGLERKIQEVAYQKCLKIIE